MNLLAKQNRDKDVENHIWTPTGEGRLGLFGMGFLELQQARGVYSRVTTGMPILNGSLLVKSGHLSRYDGHLGKLN